jgi:hypothetical protein
MATEIPSGRVFDETMILEWIVLTEGFPSVEEKRALIRLYVFLLLSLTTFATTVNKHIPCLHVAHMMPRIGPENAIYNMGGMFSISS